MLPRGLQSAALTLISRILYFDNIEPSRSWRHHALELSDTAREEKMTKEKTRLQQAKEKVMPWKKWGPYLSERQWGTVREDYSHTGDAWNYFSHDQARSRAYHWGE